MKYNTTDSLGKAHDGRLGTINSQALTNRVWVFPPQRETVRGVSVKLQHFYKVGYVYVS